MIKVIQDFIPANLPTRPGTRLNLNFITIHNTDNANPGAGAAAHNRYVRGADAVRRKVSWHYTVDDKAIFQHLPDTEKGLHAGSGTGNAQSIGIEICMNSDMNTAAGYENASDLVAALVGKHGLPFPGCMKQHNDWTGKNCPRILRAGQVIGWQAFLAKCRAKMQVIESSPQDPIETIQVEQLNQAEIHNWELDENRSVLESIDAAMAEHGGDDEAD